MIGHGFFVEVANGETCRHKKKNGCQKHFWNSDVSLENITSLDLWLAHVRVHFSLLRLVAVDGNGTLLGGALWGTRGILEFWDPHARHMQKNLTIINEPKEISYDKNTIPMGFQETLKKIKPSFWLDPLLLSDLWRYTCRPNWGKSEQWMFTGNATPTSSSACKFVRYIGMVRYGTKSHASRKPTSDNSYLKKSQNIGLHPYPCKNAYFFHTRKNITLLMYRKNKQTTRRIIWSIFMYHSWNLVRMHARVINYKHLTVATFFADALPLVSLRRLWWDQH